jgi:hypothetical protein
VISGDRTHLDTVEQARREQDELGHLPGPHRDLVRKEKVQARELLVEHALAGADVAEKVEDEGIDWVGEALFVDY